MVSILTHPIVQEDIEFVFKIVGDDLKSLQCKRILITIGTGFIGTWLLETLSWLNEDCNQPCKVYVPTRNPEAFARKAPHLASNPEIVSLPGDIADFQYPDDECNFIIHAAAPAEPRALIHDSLGVAETIVRGTRRVLELATQKMLKGFYLSVPGRYMGCNRLILREFLKIILVPLILRIFGRHMAKPNDMQKCFVPYIIKGMVFLSI